MQLESYIHTLAQFEILDLTEAYLLDQLQNRKRWPFRYSHTDQYGSLAVIDHQGQLLARQFVAGLYRMDGYLDYRNFLDLYHAGYTIQLIDILDIHPDLRTIEATLRAHGYQFTANIYMAHSDRGSASFPPHQHPYDVAVKQLYGASTWLVGDSEQELSPGSAILVPANTPHAVLAHSTPRASLTVNFG